ncbi:TIF1B factor, partial [Cepphus grylle]|nr:TIF1B factor [Cepphus grylle]
PRSRPPGGPVSTLLCKVPRVSLERLDLDLSGVAQPPVFRVFPGTSAEDFSLIVIERGAQPPPPEEQQEAAIEDTQDTKPVGLIPEHSGVLGPTGSLAGDQGSTPVPSVSSCRVCCQAGAVVMCDRCERCYHLDCHLPALQEVPSPEWQCLLCQDLPPPGDDLPDGLQEGPPQKLCPTDQWVRVGRDWGGEGGGNPVDHERDRVILLSPQKCEYVLLELLCHEPCRPLHRLS